jgi:hypothetical protein
MKAATSVDSSDGYGSNPSSMYISEVEGILVVIKAFGALHMGILLC